jgi:hypothetical protein
MALIKEPFLGRGHSINVLRGFLASAIFCASKYKASQAAEFLLIGSRIVNSSFLYKFSL